MMISKIICRIFSFLCAFTLFSACSATSSTIEPQTTPSQQPGTLITHTSQPASTFAAITSSPTNTPIHVEIPSCQDGFDSPPPDLGFGIEGFMVYWDIDTMEYVALGGTPIEKHPLEAIIHEDISNGRPIGTSPDGRILALVEYDTNSLILIDQSGSVSRTVLREDQLDLPSDPSIPDQLIADHMWLDGEYIFVKIYPRGDGEYHIPYPALFNAITGDVFDIGFYELPGRRSTNVVVPSPDLRHVVYIKFPTEMGYSLVLWDLETWQSVWSIQDFQEPGLLLSKGPADWLYLSWSPDSRSFAFTSLDVSSSDRFVYLFDLDSNGVERITYPDDRNSDHIGTLLQEWSPDSRYLAMIETTINGDQVLQQIIVYDTFSNSLVYSCPIPLDHEVFDLRWTHSSDSFFVTLWCPYIECTDKLIFHDIESISNFLIDTGVREIFRGWISFCGP